jgi:hypothetical protein
MSLLGPKPKCGDVRSFAAVGGEADSAAIAGDDKVALQVFRIVRPAMPFQIGTAGIHGPGRIDDLAI